MRQTRLGLSAGKRPISGRYLIAAIGLLLIRTQVMGAEDAVAGLSESEAVARGLSRPGLTEMWAGEIGVARSEATKAGLLPNPIAAYAREQTFGSDEATAEDYAWVLQRLDLSGRRGLRTEAAQRRVEATEDDVRSARRTLGAEIRVRFYDVLQRQRRVEAMRRSTIVSAPAASMRTPLRVVPSKRRHWPGPANDWRHC